MSMKISDLQKKLSGLGIKLSMDNIRKLETAGIVVCSYGSKGHRQLDEEQFKKSIKSLLLYYFNTPIEDIKKDDAVIIANRIKLIKKSLKFLA